MAWREQQVAIMTDKLSGAVSITRATAQMLLDFALEETDSAGAVLLTSLQQIAREILTAQSGMASLVTLFNRVFSAVAAETDSEAMTWALRETVQAFLQEQDDGRETVCRKAAALIPAHASILTHSASSTVFKTIMYAKSAGREPRVYNMEGRPLLEGRWQAAELARQGIDVTVSVDSAAYAVLQEVELVLVGVDSLTEMGVVSKVGTAGLAVCAQSLGIPCYLLAHTSKVWPAVLGEQPIHERVPGDVWAEAPAGVRVQNRIYDLTPWTAIAGVVTEQGLLTADEIRTLSRTRTVHPLLHNVIAEVRSTV